MFDICHVKKGFEYYSIAISENGRICFEGNVLYSNILMSWLFLYLLSFGVGNAQADIHAERYFRIQGQKVEEIKKKLQLNRLETKTWHRFK